MERYLHFNLVKGNGGLVNETISGVARSIASECDVGNDEVFSYWELVTCWQLISTEEYVLSLMLEGNAAILEAYGTCGNMYAVEYATSEPFLGFQLSLSDERSWDLRAQLALALLDMIEALENTVFGTLYLCDVQESNYGVVSIKLLFVPMSVQWNPTPDFKVAGTSLSLYQAAHQKCCGWGHK